MTRITSAIDTYTPRSYPQMLPDQSRYRPFRGPAESLPKIEAVVISQDPVINQESALIEPEDISLDTTVNQGSGPPPSSDEGNIPGSIAVFVPPTPPSGFNYLGIAAVTVLSGLALATLATYIPELFSDSSSIPETFLSYFDQKTIIHNSESNGNIFHETSAIQKAINLYSDSLNIEKSSSWANWATSSLGLAKSVDTIQLSHQGNANVAFTCSQLSSSEITCALDQPLAHKKGNMTLSIKETIEPLFSSLNEKMTFSESFWKSNTIEKSYQINSENQLPDLFSQILSPNNLNSWKTDQNTYAIPTQFAEHLPVN